MSEKRPIDLTRRRLLGGLGAIGVASAGAALGTSAYFSDEESFTGNSLSAGEMDLFVHYAYEGYQDGAETANVSGPAEGTVQGNADVANGEQAPVGFEIGDVKPGDDGTLEYCFSIVNNPAHLWAGGELTANDENTVTEPEASADAENNDPNGSIEGDGELADAIQVTLGSCGDADVPGLPIQGTLAEVLDQLNEEGAYLGVFDGGDSSEEPTDERCICLEWEVPTDVGNEIQSDSVAFDVIFHAEQERHNENPDSPFNATNSTSP